MAKLNKFCFRMLTLMNRISTPGFSIHERLPRVYGCLRDTEKQALQHSTEENVWRKTMIESCVESSGIHSASITPSFEDSFSVWNLSASLLNRFARSSLVAHSSTCLRRSSAFIRISAWRRSSAALASAMTWRFASISAFTRRRIESSRSRPMNATILVSTDAVRLSPIFASS